MSLYFSDTPSPLRPPPPLLYESLMLAALREDLGGAGDRTTDTIVPADLRATARLVARRAGTVAGLQVATRAFTLLDDGVEITLRVADGDVVGEHATLAILHGPARAILTAERVALNLLGRMSGIATAAAALVTAIDGSGARIVGTRKTTPGLRLLENYAIRCGGGADHRYGLADAILIKDNHVAIAGSAREAVLRAKQTAGHMVAIELEVDDLDQLRDVMDLQLDAVLLDNMAPDMLREAVSIVAGRCTTEASGGISLDTAAGIAATGVDVLSVGWLTHSAPALDIGLDVEAVAAGGRGANRAV